MTIVVRILIFPIAVLMMYLIRHINPYTGKWEG